jgi:hypothetical protein
MFGIASVAGQIAAFVRFLSEQEAPWQIVT